ncbi:hypothetical protein AAC387_Pa05g0928 [Persea americana]
MAGGEKEKDEKNVDDLDCVILEFDPLENICLSFEEEAFHRRQTLSRRRRPSNHLRTRPAHGLAIGPAASSHQSPSGAGNMVVGESFWPPCIIEWLAAWWLVGRGKLTAGNVRVLAAGIRKGMGV